MCGMCAHETTMIIITTHQRGELVWKGTSLNQIQDTRTWRFALLL